MILTKASPYVRPATNRMTDVLEKLDQSQPLAVRLAGNSTAGQSYFSDDPRSTWGFCPLGRPQRTAGITPAVSHYVTSLVAKISGREYFVVLGGVGKGAEPGLAKGLHCDKVMGVASCSYSHDSEKIQTNYFIGSSYGLGTSQTEHATVVPASMENLEPTAEESVPNHLEPATFGWTTTGFKARAAARIFSENVHADY